MSTSSKLLNTHMCPRLICLTHHEQWWQIPDSSVVGGQWRPWWQLESLTEVREISTLLCCQKWAWPHILWCSFLLNCVYTQGLGKTLTQMKMRLPFSHQQKSILLCSKTVNKFKSIKHFKLSLSQKVIFITSTWLMRSWSEGHRCLQDLTSSQNLANLLCKLWVYMIFYMTYIISLAPDRKMAPTKHHM